MIHRSILEQNLHGIYLLSIKLVHHGQTVISKSGETPSLFFIFLMLCLFFIFFFSMHKTPSFISLKRVDTKSSFSSRDSFKIFSFINHNFVFYKIKKIIFLSLNSVSFSKCYNYFLRLKKIKFLSLNSVSLNVIECIFGCSFNSKNLNANMVF